MQFKTNHSPGPFEIHHEDGDWFILDVNGRIIAETWGADNEDMSEVNRHLFCASPSMLEYMMERAKKLSEEISYGDSVADHFELIGYMEPEKREELQTILSILKDAGVEVVE